MFLSFHDQVNSTKRKKFLLLKMTVRFLHLPKSFNVLYVQTSGKNHSIYVETKYNGKLLTMEMSS